MTLVDDLLWLPGWVQVELDEQRRLMAQIVSEPTWVLDSSYGTSLDLVLPRVTSWSAWTTRGGSRSSDSYAER